MGAGNVKLVYALWKDLPDKPFRALVWMALRSLDDDKPPKYWAGWEELAFAAGRMVPNEVPGDKDVARQRRAALESVRVIVGKLLEHRAVSIVGHPAPGRNTIYAINFDRTVQADPGPSPASTVQDQPGSSQRESRRDEHVTNVTNAPGSAWTTLQGEPVNAPGSAWTTLQGEPGPEEKEEVLEEKTRNDASDPRTPLTVRAREADNEEPIFSTMKNNGDRRLSAFAQQSIAEAQARMAAARLKAHQGEPAP